MKSPIRATVPKKNNPNLISVGEGFGLFVFFDMKTIKSCAFNIDTDTACVELRFQVGSRSSIDCTAVENEAAGNCFRRL